MRGQDNYLLYRPQEKVTLCINEHDRIVDIYRSIAAALICHCPLLIVAPKELLERHRITSLGHHLLSFKADDDHYIPYIFQDSREGKVRILSEFPDEWFKISAEKFVFLQAIPVYSSGRLELLHYLRPMSVSDNYHRYGNLGNKKKH